MKEDNSVKYGLIGLSIGVAAGVAAGMLLAPKSGKEARDIIASKAGQAKEGAVAKLKKTNAETKKVAKKAKKATAAAKKELKR